MAVTEASHVCSARVVHGTAVEAKGLQQEWGVQATQEVRPQRNPRKWVHRE